MTGTCGAHAPFMGEHGAPQECLLESGHTGAHRNRATVWAPEQQPQPIAPDTYAALGKAGDEMLAAVMPLVRLVGERDAALDAVLPRLVALQESLRDVMALLDARGVHPNWATEVRTLETARNLLASMTVGAPDGKPTHPR